MTKGAVNEGHSSKINIWVIKTVKIIPVIGSIPFPSSFNAIAVKTALKP